MRRLRLPCSSWCGIFSSIVAYILVSAVLAVIGCRFVGMLVRLRIGGRAVPRWLAALVTLLLFWAVFAAICSLALRAAGHQQALPAFDPRLPGRGGIGGGADRAGAELPRHDLRHSGLGILHAEAISSTLREVVNVDSVNTLFSSALGITFSSLIAFFSPYRSSRSSS